MKKTTQFVVLSFSLIAFLIPQILNAQVSISFEFFTDAWAFMVQPLSQQPIPEIGPWWQEVWEVVSGMTLKQLMAAGLIAIGITQGIPVFIILLLLFVLAITARHFGKFALQFYAKNPFLAIVVFFIVQSLITAILFASEGLLLALAYGFFATFAIFWPIYLILIIGAIFHYLLGCGWVKKVESFIDYVEEAIEKIIKKTVEKAEEIWKKATERRKKKVKKLGVKRVKACKSWRWYIRWLCVAWHRVRQAYYYFEWIVVTAVVWVLTTIIVLIEILVAVIVFVLLEVFRYIIKFVFWCWF